VQNRDENQAEVADTKLTVTYMV